MEQFDAQLIGCRYGERVTMDVAVSGEHSDLLNAQLLELTRGQADVSWLSD